MTEIVEEPLTIETLGEYSTIPIAFLVRSYYVPTPIEDQTNKWELAERNLEESYIKNYDEIESPREWAARFNRSQWGMLTAREENKRIGGAVIAWNTPGVDMLEGRTDLAVVWDIRIHPDYRKKLVGSLLFTNAMQWAVSHGCRELKIETQNLNVPACKFYGRMGCELQTVREGVYFAAPNEIQFLWHRKL